MAKARSKPWKSKWKEIEPLGGGGQGRTFLVSPQSSLEPQSFYVLKILNDQSNGERRKRMYRELAALRTLDHPGIPKVIESNADAFDDPTQDLFVITTFIPGPTLATHIQQQKQMVLTDASMLLIKLVEILIYCHQQTVIHRDIKPDNIIIREASVDDPVLLDFGLSFNRTTDGDDELTPSLQQVGNRFLALPELQLKSATKRDHRSDITQLCGIFFYTLTGTHPVTLLDHHAQLPHQRPRAQTKLASLRHFTRLNRFFDTGFNSHIDRRYQSAEALRQSLLDLVQVSDVQEGESIGDKLAKLRQWQADDRESVAHQYLKLFETTQKRLNMGLETSRDSIGHSVSTIHGSCTTDLASLKFYAQLGLFMELHENHKFFCN